MANSFRMKRRASPGGAPPTLLNGEQAFNETDQILWYGSGDVGAGVAATIIPIGGRGFVPWLSDVATASPINEDVATATAVYPTWVTANTGNLGHKTSSTKLRFVPSTGILTATGFAGSAAGLTGLPAASVTGTLPSAVLGASTLYVGTTAIALNRASANLGLTGITAVALAGSTSGSVTIQAPAVAGSSVLTMPAVTGTVITTGDTGTVTNAMLASSTVTVGSTAVTLGGAAVTTFAGLVSVTSTTFVGALTGNATTATTATKATNIVGGAAGSIPYQTALDTTTMLAAGNSAQVLIGGATPSWANLSGLTVGIASTAGALSGGSAGRILYQSGVGVTSSVAAGATTQVLIGGAAAPSWTNISSLAVGSATSATNATNLTTGVWTISQDAGSKLTISGTNGAIAIRQTAQSIELGEDTSTWVGTSTLKHINIFGSSTVVCDSSAVSTYFCNNAYHTGSAWTAKVAGYPAVLTLGVASELFISPASRSAGAAATMTLATGTSTTYFRPGVNNTMTLGGASNKWTTVYATTGTINTSDERNKAQIQSVSDQVLDAWAEVEYYQYKFLDAIAAKGDANARIHIGLVAQRVKQVFEAHNLDPFQFGLLCYDEWAEELVDNAAGQSVRPAGNVFGVRYEEAFAMECALMRRTTNRLQQQLNTLI